MMLSVSTMALAAVLGSSCPGNQASLNNCNQPAVNNGYCVQHAQNYQNGNAGLNAILSQMGASCPANLCDGQDFSCPTGSCGLNGTGFQGNGMQIPGFNAAGCNTSGFSR